MLISKNLLITADDFGLNPSVNKAILTSFEQGYINSTSFLTNTPYFEESVDLIHANSYLKNIGVHINFAEDKPLTNFSDHSYLDEAGNWDTSKANSKISYLNSETRQAFAMELNAQIEKALASKVKIVHLNSHFHLHTLPHFYNLFIDAAKHYKLKLRLAQTYSEGSLVKFYYRKFINNKIKRYGLNFSDYFETVDRFLEGGDHHGKVVEIMVHPDYDSAGNITDHVDKSSMERWMSYLNK
jgi:predicted glycoside hydrolase/deacetylase ChbG (UPF0249 family)